MLSELTRAIYDSAAMDSVMALGRHPLAQQAQAPLPAGFERRSVSLTEHFVLLIELADQFLRDFFVDKR